MKLKVTVNGKAYEVDVEVEEEVRPGLGAMTLGSHGAGSTPTAPTSTSVTAATSNSVTAPLAGSVARIVVGVDDSIEAGQVLVVLEAMKMETEITAPRAGKIKSILVAPGDAVQGGQPLLELAE